MWCAQLEIRGVRSRALAMVDALRKATESLGREHKAAHSILERHFDLLEQQVTLTDLDLDSVPPN